MSARSPVAPMPALARSATSLREMVAIGLEIVDGGDVAVGADADMVLAADLHRVLDVGDDVLGGGVAARFRNGMK